MSISRFGPPTCPACFGGECKGGGWKICVQRDPKPSHIAAIVDIYGGLRTVVAHKSTFKSHLRPDELLFIVPDKLVHEPIAWGDIPMVIHLSELAVQNHLELHGLPNEPNAWQALRMYQLRCLEHPHYKRALNLELIATT